MPWVIVIVIFELMSRMVVFVVTTWYVIVVFLIPGVDVCEAMIVFVLVFVKMVMLNLSMSMPVCMKVFV